MYTKHELKIIWEELEHQCQKRGLGRERISPRSKSEDEETKKNKRYFCNEDAGINV
jgi:hypothetical protein